MKGEPRKCPSAEDGRMAVDPPHGGGLNCLTEEPENIEDTGLNALGPKRVAPAGPSWDRGSVGARPGQAGVSSQCHRTELSR